MKNVIKSFAAAVVVFAFGSDASAQVTASSNISATIVQPITITKTVDLSFGNVAVSAGTGGTVVVNAQTGNRSSTGGVTLPATAGTVTAASFDVAGAANYTYSITLPGSNITINDGGSNTMTVGTFTSFPATTGTLNGSGAQTLKVAATLNVAAGQAAGTYGTGSTFDVTVNYN
jgi:hypothetical protein